MQTCFHTRSTLIALGILSALACPRWLGARVQAAYPQWSHSTDLVLNTSASGANISTNLLGFPVLVSLSATQSELFLQAAANGADLRFAKLDGSPLPYQIELWDAAAKKAEVWVGLDTLYGLNATQHIRMFWGKPDAMDSSSGKSVFPGEKGFRGVWHLGAKVEDASANLNHGTDSGTTLATDGRIGQARYFDNPESYATTGKYISLGAPASMNIGGAITMSAWVKWNRRDNHRIILCHGGAQGATAETVLRIGETLDYRAGAWNGTDHYATVAAPPADSLAWIQLTGVYTGSQWELYRNGVKVSTTTPDTNGAKASPASWRIGAEYVSKNISRYFSGWLDEVRLSNVARSPDWIKANYENQKTGQSLVNIGVTSALLPVNRMPRAPGKGNGPDSDFEFFFPLGQEKFDAQGRRD